MSHLPHHHHHRRATRYAYITPPPPPLNNHLRNHHHVIIYPNAILPENYIWVPSHIPALLDHNLRHRLPMAPYNRPNANPNHQRAVLDDQRIAVNRRAENTIFSRVSRDSSVDSGDEKMVVHEFTSTPKKPERRSAFLRIQLPKPKDENSEIHNLNYAGFDLDSNPNYNSLRCKDNKHVSLGNGKKKSEKKEGSPVEVDISFDSNSLVAKAVVSNTDVTVVSDPLLTASLERGKKGKKRKALVTDNVSSDSHIGKPSTGAVSSYDTSSSCKVLMLHNGALDSCSRAVDNPHGEIQVAQSSKGVVPDEIVSLQSDKTSLRVIKKKKIAKKVVKKVVKLNSYKLSPLSANILVGSWMAGGVTRSGSTDSASAKIKKTSLADKSTEDKKGTHSSSQEFNTDKGSDMGIKTSISKPPSVGSSKEGKRTDPSMKNTDKVAESLNGSTPEVNHTDDDQKHSCPNGMSLLPGKDSNVGCPKSSANNSISANGRVAALCSNILTARSEENPRVCDIGNDDDFAGKACCERDPPTLSQDVNQILTNSGMASCSSSGKTIIQDGPDCLQASVVKQCSDGEIFDSEDSTTFPHGDIVNDTGKQMSPSNFVVSSDNCEIQSFPDANIPVGYGEGDTKMDDMAPDVESPVGHANDVDTTLNLWKHPSSSENSDHSVQRSVFSSQFYINDITTSNVKKGVSEAELYFGNSHDNDADNVSSLYKRKKTNASYPEFTESPSELSVDPKSLSYKQAHKEEVAWLSMGVSAFPSVPYTEDVAKWPDNSLGGECSLDLNREMETSENLDLHHLRIASNPLLEESFTPNIQFSMLEGEQKEKATLILPGNTEADDLLPLNNSCNSSDALVETGPDGLPTLPSQGITSEVCDRWVSDCSEMNKEKICVDRRNLDTKSVIERSSDIHTFTSPTQRPGKIMKLDHSTGQSNLTMKKTMPQPSLVPSEVSIQQSNGLDLNGRKSKEGCVAPKTLKGRSFIFSKPRTPASSTHISKPRTWHRTGNNSPASLPGTKPSVSSAPPKKSNIQNASYIRKGNSLVRKPTSVSASSQVSVANQLPSLGLDESRKCISSKIRFSATDQSHLLNSGAKSSPLKRKGTVALPTDSELENGSSPLIVNLSVGCCESAEDLKNGIETNDVPFSSEEVLKYSVTFENQIGISNDGASQVEADDGNISSSNGKRTEYIKPKSCQLVATSNFCVLSVSKDEETQTTSSDGYYKNGNNQLLRTSSVNHNSPTVIMPNSNVNSLGPGSLCKPLKTSLVWTPSGKSSPKNYIDSRNCQKFFSQMFPWKMSISRRRFIQNPASSYFGSSSSATSKKLLLLRKRDSVYLRSTHGFSLRKSNVIGVDGSSSKWSKSIYRRSAKVVKEPTLAVAAVEREKREQKDATFNSSRAKNIEPLPSASTQSGLVAKGYIPRYVRIGNENQLIRDPRRRTRMLANKKVRWSLHSARQRLARKQKYCQFFTRFGKCNKGDGNCPYIHDPSKIAVCTKFLNGLCSNANCKLTHKVIPERMPDCSYFLQGLCTNSNCPYRHVSVNPKASICGEFLKGYCGDGYECRKKHSYVCPTFEETGSCQAGTKCKLHHPKKQGERKKRKRSRDQNKSEGRYFGSIPVAISEPGMMVAQRHCQQSNNDKEGEVADFISIEVDEEVEDCVIQSYEQATMCLTDDLIRPVLIM